MGNSVSCADISRGVVSHKGRTQDDRNWCLGPFAAGGPRRTVRYRLFLNQPLLVCWERVVSAAYLQRQDHARPIPSRSRSWRGINVDTVPRDRWLPVGVILMMLCALGLALTFIGLLEFSVGLIGGQRRCRGKHYWAGHNRLRCAGSLSRMSSATCGAVFCPITEKTSGTAVSGMAISSGKSPSMS
jgi:hypothetical protein